MKSSPEWPDSERQILLRAVLSYLSYGPNSEGQMQERKAKQSQKRTSENISLLLTSRSCSVAMSRLLHDRHHRRRHHRSHARRSRHHKNCPFVVPSNELVSLKAPTACFTPAQGLLKIIHSVPNASSPCRIHSSVEADPWMTSGSCIVRSEATKTSVAGSSV